MQLKQSAPLGTGPSVKAAEALLSFKPESCTCSTIGEKKGDTVTAGTEGPWSDLAMQCVDDHMEQDLPSTSQAQLFTAYESYTYRSLNFLGLW